MKKLLHIILILTNILLVVAIVLSYLSSYISPEKFWFLPFFGLGFPYFALGNLFFLIYWIIRKRKFYFLSLIVLISGSVYLNDFVQINLSSDTKPQSAKIMSYNVRLFDLYSWSDKMESKNSIFKLLKKEAPNIICFQEFYNDISDEFITLDSILTISDTKFYHDEYTFDMHDTYYFGIATVSTYPIVNKGKIRFENTNNICIFTDIKINDDTIRVYNNHLQSIHFKKEDYSIIDSIEQIGKKDVAQVKNIFNKIKDASAIRAEQVEAISNHIKMSPYPVFVCGDFNDTPISYTYKKMSEGLIDAFAESGNGIGSTHNSKIPFLRIDFILHSPQISTSGFEIIECNYSDHFPISCHFEIEKKNK
ncbi:MAG: hypothetical protein A2W98_05260 [Bacteroidetes bacterium GWF2_33_38]|nr:MAG: hypothetical protein A2W98_05260 [Bacteroidetes bacterium GWF2_33_38]OFY75384.1 MAG: hypothetical protein A2265_06455 [Bacteroidetes bacterium RIFOXYA12_FULL_33_9]OFY92181.1 MAG: hypothetical protein A2236_11900 [Bacteroidetes bacterium RIFOXYA2_FULL_33_7]